MFKLLHLEMWMKANDVRSKAETLLFCSATVNSSAAPDNASDVTHTFKGGQLPKLPTTCSSTVRAQPLCYCQGTSCTCSLTTHTLPECRWVLGRCWLCM